MVPLNSNLNYEPPQEVVRLWKNTYSISTLYDGVTLPGLIKTNYFYLHFTSFILVLIGEFYGWYIISTIQNGYDLKFFTFVLIDCVLIVPILKFNGKLKLIASKILLLDNTQEFEKFTLKRNATRNFIYLIACKCVLFSIAGLKIYSLFSANYIPQDTSNPTISNIIIDGIGKVELLPLVVVYLLVATIHAFFSSYFWGHLFLSYKIRSGEKLGENVTQHRTMVLPNSVPFREAEAISGTNFHYITRKIIVKDLNGIATFMDDTNPNSSNLFKLHTWGLLTDEQLNNLVWAQQIPTIKRELALICLKHQLDLMGE